MWKKMGDEKWQREQVPIKGEEDRHSNEGLR